MVVERKRLKNGLELQCILTRCLSYNVAPWKQAIDHCLGELRTSHAVRFDMLHPLEVMPLTHFIRLRTG